MPDQYPINGLMQQPSSYGGGVNDISGAVAQAQGQFGSGGYGSSPWGGMPNWWSQPNPQTPQSPMGTPPQPSGYSGTPTPMRMPIQGHALATGGQMTPQPAQPPAQPSSQSASGPQSPSASPLSGNWGGIGSGGGAFNASPGAAGGGSSPINPLLNAGGQPQSRPPVSPNANGGDSTQLQRRNANPFYAGLIA